MTHGDFAALTIPMPTQRFVGNEEEVAQALLEYVHTAGTVEEMVRRMGAGVAPGGTLFLVGHRSIDPAIGAATPAAGQVQVSVQAAGTGVDAVILARRLA